MIELLKTHKAFFYPFVFVILIGALYFPISYTHGDWVLWFCDNFNLLNFQIFEYLTLLGEPQVTLPVILVVFLFNMGSGALIFFSWLFSSVITIALKSIINSNRPPYYFQEIFESCAGQLDYIYNHSTPSGHTTAAFAFFASLAMLSKHKGAQFVFLCLAVLVGLSRIVLFVHFFYDVYIGALVGTITTFLIFWLFLYKNIFKFNRWKNKSILQRKL